MLLPQRTTRPHHLLVHDPHSSLHTGDVIALQPGWRVSKTVHHVVTRIIAPWGKPIEERPPVPTEEERLEVREEKRARKLKRREERGQNLEHKAEVGMNAEVNGLGEDIRTEVPLDGSSGQLGEGGAEGGEGTVRNTGALEEALLLDSAELGGKIAELPPERSEVPKDAPKLEGEAKNAASKKAGKVDSWRNWLG